MRVFVRAREPLISRAPTSDSSSVSRRTSSLRPRAVSQPRICVWSRAPTPFVYTATGTDNAEVHSPVKHLPPLYALQIAGTKTTAGLLTVLLSAFFFYLLRRGSEEELD